MDGLRLVTMVYVSRRIVEGLRWLMMDEYVRLCTICEDKLCSNLPRESNRIIFQSKYYLEARSLTVLIFPTMVAKKRPHR